MQHILCSKERGKRLGALVMTLVMVFFAMTAALPAAEAVTQKDIDNLKSQAASLKEQKSDIQKKLDKLSNSKNSALDQKFLLEEKINVLREQIALSEQSIQEYGKQIDQKEEELAAAKEEEAKYYDEFCERVRSMEERGNVSYWAVLFNANSFSDLLDQINAISEVMDYDNEVMDNLAAARQAVADAKAELEESKAAEESAKADLETQKADLVKEQASVEATIQEITSQSSVYAQKMDELEDDSASVSSQIAQAEKTYQNCPFHGQELHGGCDIPAPYGTPIKAAKSGVVIISTYGSSYGNYVTIAHSDGSRTMYAHQSQRAVSAGQTVSQGEVIGYVGSTGSSTGNHLHFELWLNSSSSSRVNPVAYCF